MMELADKPDKNLRRCTSKVTPVDSTEDEAGNTPTFMRAWKVAARPTKKQEAIFWQYAGAARWAYNWALGQSIAHYEETKKSLHKYEASKRMTALKASDPDLAWLNTIPRDTIDYSIEAVHLAYQHFFRRCKSGETPGFPRFKARGRCTPSFRVRKSIIVESGRIRLPGIGWLRLQERNYCPCMTPDEVAFATVSYRAGRWFVAITGKFSPTRLPNTGRATAIALDGLCLVKDGEALPEIGPYRALQRRLARIQRRVSRRQTDSKRREKAVLALQKCHAKIARKREWEIHNRSRSIVDANDSIAVIRPKLKPRLEEKVESLELSDNAHGEFFRQLLYKTKWAGRCYEVMGEE